MKKACFCSSAVVWGIVQLIFSVNTQAADVSITRSGAGVSYFDPGYANYTLNSAYNGGIVLGDGFDQSQAVYEFYVPGNQQTADLLTSITITIHGSGTITNLILGNKVIGSVSDNYSLTLTGNDVKNGLGTYGDPVHGDVFRVYVYVTDWLDRYDLEKIEFTYTYPDANATALEHYHTAYSGYNAIHGFRTKVVDQTWDIENYQSDEVLKKAVQETGSLCQNILDFDENIYDATKAFFNALDNFQNLADLIYAGYEWIEFWGFYPTTGPTVDQIKTACDDAATACANAAVACQSYGFDGTYTSSEATDMLAKLQNATSKLNILKNQLSSAAQDMQDIYTGGNNQAKVAKQSMAPLMRYAEESMDLLDSYLPNLIADIEAQKAQFVTVTIDASPSDRSLKIKVDGVEYTNSATFTWVTSSSHTIEAPSPQTGNDSGNYVFVNWTDGGARVHTINPSGNTTIAAYYLMVTGSLTVTIDPVGVRGSAKWRLTSGPDTNWRESGDSLNNIPIGDYTLQFNEISGWQKPSDRTIIISEGSNAESGTYIRLPVITARTPSSGPPGTYMKIEGQYFGGSGSVIFAGGAIGQILSWSDTEILCKVPGGASSGNVVVQTSVSSNGVNYTITDPTTIYVDHIYTPNIENGTTTYPFSTIQRGIDAATTSDEVVVAEGTYTGQGNRDIELGKAITVRSSNPTDPNIVAATIIDCQGSASEPHRGFNMGNVLYGPILNGLTIENGYADYGGGVSCPRPYNENSIIVNCIIRNNTADYGGGMYSLNSYPTGTTVTNCTFSGNVSNSQGGGMYISRGIMTNCVINGNIANSDGGGIYGGGIFITDCAISSNTSYGRGGGICGYGRSGGYALITACNISKNTSVLEAGGIRIGRCDINDCTINENESNGDGGGVVTMTDIGPSTISNCVISNNTSKGSGGGILTSSFQSIVTITNCSFIGNNAVYSGGGLAARETAGTVSHCTFSENSAADGGGMSNLAWSSQTVTNCVFTANVADTYGGGMYNMQVSSPTVMNCIFAGNISLQSGGAICNIMWSSPIITNCTLSANSADVSGGGMCSISDNNSIVENCILWGNTSPSGAQICDMEGSSTSVTYSDVQGGEAGVYQDPNCTLSWGPGNLDSNPCFIMSGYWDPNGTPEDINDDFWVDGDYHLLSDSPCIDTGDPNYVIDPNEHDIDGDNRIIGGRIDIGADEFVYIGDFDFSGSVDFTDLSILALQWLQPPGTPSADIAPSPPDGIVNFLDYAVLADHWLEGISP